MTPALLISTGATSLSMNVNEKTQSSLPPKIESFIEGEIMMEIMAWSSIPPSLLSKGNTNLPLFICYILFSLLISVAFSENHLSVATQLSGYV